MLNDELFERGIATMEKLMGPEAAAATRKRHDAAIEAGTAEQNDYSTQLVFGFMLNRPQLPLRDRILVILASDITQGTTNALRDHVQIALNIGISREEIYEVVFQLSQYCGFPRAREARVAVGEIFAELDKK